MVNALDRRLMRRASVTSCGKVPCSRYLRKGLVQDGPLGAAGSSSSFALLPSLSATGFAVATWAGAFTLPTSAATAGARVLVLIDLWPILSRKTPGGIGPRVDPMFASLSASV